MIGVPVSPRRVFGVALAAGMDAGDRTWVCRAHPGSEGIRLESVERLARLPGGASESQAAYRTLVGKILEAPRSAWGLDFAFGLPLAGADAPTSPAAGQVSARWRADLADMASRAVDGLQPEGTAARRQTDADRGLTAPLADDRGALTRAGMGAVLHRLHGQAGIVVLPFDPLPVLPAGTPPAMVARAPSTYVLEVSPACTLRELAMDTNAPPPGGDAGVDGAEGREAVVRALTRAGWVRPVPRALRRHAAEDERALSAVLAAVGAWRGYRTVDHGALHRHVRFGVEGYVYC